MIQKFFFRIIVLIMLLGLAVTVYGYYSYRRPLPQTEGAVQVPGLRESVTIYRDAWGVPHIYAAYAQDLFLAQGYVHAQDRWWQMEMNRHIGMGTLSTIMGNDERIQGTDRFIRTLGWSQTAQGSWNRASAESRAALRAYARGINSYIENRSQGELAVQYTVLGLTGRDFEIEPWEPLHSLAWLTAFGWQQSGNFLQEMDTATLVGHFGDEVPLGVLSNRSPEVDYSRLPSQLVGGLTPSELAFLSAALPRSSAWVVSGKLTESGLPLLANDFQSSVTIPSDWYEIGLHCVEITPDCPYNVTGFSLAGIPGVMVGHNEAIAWGMSVANIDTQDLFILRLNPENPFQYEADGTWADMQVRHETIEVNGAEAITQPVYTTQFGTVVTEILPQNRQQALALRWMGAAPADAVGAILQINTAQNWVDFQQALEGWGAFPAEFLYADLQGNIGLRLAGYLLRQDRPHNLPTAAEQGDDESATLAPYKLSVYNPSSGWLAAANQGVAMYAPAWDADQRASRIRQLLQATDQHNADTFVEIQADTYNAFALRLTPYLMNLQWVPDPEAEDFDEGAYQEWLDYRQWLGEWDFRNEADSPYPVLFSMFWAQLVDRVFDDELSMETGGGDAQRQMIFDLLEQPDHPWWDDVRTLDQVEDRDLTLRTAFAAAIDAAQDQFGGVRERWQWGELHTATFRSIPLGDNPVAEITELLNRGTVAVGGDSDSLNSTRWSTTRANRYQVTALSAFRMILDLGDFENSRSILSTGQSGHPASDHYDDMIELWRGVGYRDMLWDFDAIHRASEDRLILEPAPMALG